MPTEVTIHNGCVFYQYQRYLNGEMLVMSLIRGIPTLEVTLQACLTASQSLPSYFHHNLDILVLIKPETWVFTYSYRSF